jgi:hypothetical protein
MLKPNDDALHASYSKHLALGGSLKGLIKFAKDRGIQNAEIWPHEGGYAMRYQGRDGETRQLSLGAKFGDARRVILSLSAKPKTAPATKSLSVRPGEKGKIKPYVSSVKGVWEVLNADGKTVFKSKDKQEALSFWKKNYTRMVDGNMSLSNNSMAGEIAKLKKAFPKFEFSVTPSGQIKGRSDTKIVTGKDANEIIKKLGAKLSLAAPTADELKAKIAKLVAQEDKIIKSGGRVGPNDPITRQRKALIAQLKKLRAS